jgi:acyl CoA:acetate/3-ketoacid CoA transferase alpha subunit/acyl CoA:acetate/3-ketoacid CoA transferase beta subunit
MTVPSGFPLTAGGPIDPVLLAEHWNAQLSAPPTESKVMGLAEAIRTSVRAQDTVYLGGSMARPNGAAFEMVRQLHGTDPRLTIVAPAFTNQHAVLVHSGLVGAVITSFHGNNYPGPGPNPIFSEAERSGSVRFEDWSMLTLALRLYAAATNVPFLPTRSLIGSDMGRALTAAGLLKVVDDPFGGDAQIALVPPLHPDVTIVHSLMADAAGNAVMSPPYYEDAWAAFAARRRVIVTTEKIVSTETVRRNAQFVRVPGMAVTAVCEVPFGGHPNLVPADLVPEVDGYCDDYEFLVELRAACRDPEALAAWTKQWVLGVADHDEYLSQLGKPRLRSLQERTRGDGWQGELAMLDERWSDPASPGELNVALGARYLHRLVVREGLRTGLAGVGVSTLAAWLSATSLHEAGVAFDLMAEGGMYGVTPLPLDPYLFNYRNLFTCTSLSNVQTILGVVTGGYANRTVGVLGAAEVDSHGSINTSRVKGRMLTGSGGGNDIASNAEAIVVTTLHNRARLPETVEFVTSPGTRVRAIVTDRAVLERLEPGGEFRLTGILDRGGAKDDLVRAAVEGCGWPLAVAGEVELFSPVSGQELAAIRTYDPTGNFVL